MPNINLIITSIDHYLKLKNKKTVEPAEINDYLEKKGILKNSASRPGLPIRNLLRKGKIPHAYQIGVRWQIPMSNRTSRNLKPVNKPNSHKIRKPKNGKTNTGHKLTVIAELLAKILNKTYGKTPDYILEYKPDWLISYPSKAFADKHPFISDLYSDLTDKKLTLTPQMDLLSDRKLKQKQSFDIWFNAPYNFAVEFDEKQHFNQYRKITLDYYKKMNVAFPVKLFKELNSNAYINSGTSGFTKLRSNDPLFPELLNGDKQDNRIRQRAFRDFLKDLLPVENGHNPTLRIPYQIVNKKIKDFSQDDLKNIVEYITQYHLI